MQQKNNMHFFLKLFHADKKVMKWIQLLIVKEIKFLLMVTPSYNFGIQVTRVNSNQFFFIKEDRKR